MKSFLGVACMLLISHFASSQCLLNGKITSEKGESLIGANIVLKETRQGASADEEGFFSIENISPGNYTLMATFIGYETLTKKIEISEESETFFVNLQLPEQTINIEAAIVTATRAGERTPMTYTNLGKEEIERNNLGQDVPMLLQWSPSAVVTSDAGAGVGYSGIRIRGTDPTRINVTINGIPLNDSESQSVYWVDLPDFASSANDIQIQRGVGTSTNGAGAFGATINLNTSKLHKDPYATISGSVGSFDTYKGNVQFGTGLLKDKFTMDGRMSKVTSNGYIDRATSDLSSYYLSGAYMGETNSLRFNVFSGHEVTYQAWYGVPADKIDDRETRTFNPAGMEKAQEPGSAVKGSPYDNEVDDYRQTHYQLIYNDQLNRNLNMNVALHYTRGSGFYEQYKAFESLEDYGLSPVQLGQGIIVTETDLIRQRWLENDFYGTTFSLRHQTNNNRLETILGGGWNQYQGNHFGEVIWVEFMSDGEKGHRYYDNDGDKQDFNFFGKLNYELTYGLFGFLDLQYRSINYDFLGYDNQGQNVTQNDQLHFFNPKGGILYKLNEESDIYASFAVANREPNRNDYTESTPDSRPEYETLYNTEIGYRQSTNKAAFGVNLYHMLYKNQLALTGEINDVGEYSRRNIEDSYRFGLELTGSISILKNLQLNANATFSQNKVKAFTEYYDDFDVNFGWIGQQAILHKNTDLAFSPNIIAGGELTYDVLKNSKVTDSQNLNISLLSKFVGKQYIDNTSDENNILDPYFFSDIRIRYAVKTSFLNEIELTLLVMNIFDNLYETNAWSYRYGFDNAVYIDQGFYPQAGRNFLLGVNLHF
ncbi:MAG: TonB-dependent receptor [Bacteroidetes bacterium]|nr:TonB-dependent receptor [Bacteroidota bacterium]